MSEEEPDNLDVGVAPEPSALGGEPSFHGRLQLADFMFGGVPPPAHASRALRRSPRLQKAQQTPSSSDSATATPSAPSTPAPTLGAVPQRRTSRRRASPLKRGADDDEGEGEGEESSSTSPRKKKKEKKEKKPRRAASGYAPPSTYAHLPPLPDVLAPGLLVLFIGLNPGVRTAREGHAYAHPSNLFWRLLHTSGLTPVRCRPDEDRTLPARFALGNTNIVARPSRSGAELSRAEMDAGVARLEAACRRWRPEAVCVVGKGIWESIFRVRRGRDLRRGDGFAYGWQDDGERMGAVEAGAEDANASEAPAADAAALPGGGDVEPRDGDGEGVDDGPWEGSRIFVATSTSGLAAGLRLEEKERIWKVLGDWCVQRRKERAEQEKRQIGASSAEP
ncbi:DNA glycosylase [Xylaria palmicola]|nr:DNA glycosylase [Xylaria palmicola]